MEKVKLALQLKFKAARNSRVSDTQIAKFIYYIKLCHCQTDTFHNGGLKNFGKRK